MNIINEIFYKNEKTFKRNGLLLILIAFFIASCTSKTGINNLERIYIQGNKFVNTDGDTIIFRGLDLSDPLKLYNINKWNMSYFKEAKKWGANIIRIPVHPKFYKEIGKEEYLRLLDLGIKFAKELNLYVIIDWHIIGNLKDEKFPRNIYNTTKTETIDFWKTIAKHYRGNNTIAFFEIYNEPTDFKGKLGNLSWEGLKPLNEEIIDSIQAIDNQKIVLIAGLDFGYDLKPIIKRPIERKGIAYVSHPYPMKTSHPWENNWEKDFGFIVDKYPLLATEIGFMNETEHGAHIPCIGTEAYGDTLISYFDKKGISWTAWCFDPDWPPVLFTDWNYTPSNQGLFFKKILHIKNLDNEQKIIIPNNICNNFNTWLQQKQYQTKVHQ